MIMRIYLLCFVAFIFFTLIHAFIAAEGENADCHCREKELEIIYKILGIMKKIDMVAFILFSIYNLVILFIPNLSIIIRILSISYVIFMIFSILFHKIMDCNMFIGSIFFVCALLFPFISFYSIVAGTQASINDIKEAESKYVYSIDIVEMEKVPYTNVHGSIFYIRSSPSLAYYYSINTSKGGKVTKVIDGYTNYVEVFEDDIYIDNPHIEVYHMVETYTNLYGVETEEFLKNEYRIYIPKGSRYYEQ